MQHLEDLPPIRINRAEGLYLYADNQPPLMDAISSWWVNLHGHNHPLINAALHAQIDRFSHIMLAGLTHEPVETLARRLTALLPDGLDRVFFADSGSAAIEIALKMSLQYWHQQGETGRRTFISLQNGYHGETLGSLSVTDIPLFSRQYEPLLIKHLRTPVPDSSTRPAGMTAEQHVRECLDQLEVLLQRQGHEICALILEPLVQGAAGMHMYPAAFIDGIYALKKQYHFQLVFDEIAVGFGRTGTLFAFEQTTGIPDFLCLSKGLTGGYLPMSAVVTSSHVYDAFYHPALQRGFLHSHSYAGNALACQAALASLDLLAQPETWQNIRQIERALATGLQQLATGLPHICNVRSLGVIGAFELDYHFDRMALIAEAVKRGVWLRPIGNTLYCMLPYCTTPDQAGQIVQVMGELADWTSRQPIQAAGERMA